MQSHVLLEERQHAIRECTHLRRLARTGPLQWRRNRAHERSTGHVACDLRSCKALDKNAGASVRKTSDLEDSPEDAGSMKIGSSGLLGLPFFLGNQENELVGLDRSVDRGKRWRPPYQKGNYDVRKNYDVAERKNGDACCSLELLSVAREFVGQVRCPMSDTRCPMPDARYPIKISDVRQRKSDVGHRASVIGLRFFLAPERRDLEQRLGAVGDAGFSDLDLDHILAAREIEHDLHQHFLENCAEATRAGPPLQRLLRDCGESSLVERDLHFLEPEELRVLLREGVLRLLENPDQ